jgi:hypothetical protein
MQYRKCLSAVEGLLPVNERQEIVSRLANYHIPIQILQLVADECGCGEVVEGRREAQKRSESPLVARLNDRALVQLKHIFLDCKDSFSGFRFATFLSSKFTPFSYKFVMAKKVHGKSNEHVVDICIYSRNTEDLVAIGIQNNDADSKAADAKSLHAFLDTISDILAEHPSLRSAYYSTSYGYQHSPSHLAAKSQKLGGDNPVEIKFLEYQNDVYRQVKE